MTQQEKEARLRHFDGLVIETTRQIIATGVELEFDDVAQLLRIKVWHAVEKFDAERAAASKFLSHARDRHGRSPLERFVYGCVANMRKDIEKRPRRFNQSIEGIRDRSTAKFDRFGGVALMGIADWFDLRYLSVDHEDVFGEVEGDDPPLPSTLTEVERQVVGLRLDGLMLMEIDRELGLSRGERERVMRSVREKLADWRPDRAGAPLRAPVPPLPRPVQRRRAVRSPQAA